MAENQWRGHISEDNQKPGPEINSRHGMAGTRGRLADEWFWTGSDYKAISF